MPSFERGVYEPPSDDVHVFDDEEQDLDEEGSRLPLLIVIALLVLAAFAGVVWLAYSQGLQRGRSDAPRMIVSEPGPVKEAAASSSAGHALKIYEQPAPAENPKITAKKSVGVPKSAHISQSAATTMVDSNAALKVPSVTKAPVIAVVPEAKPPVVAPKGALSIPHKVDDTPPAPAEVKPQTAKPVEKANTPAVSDGSYVLQIGAYKSEADADTAWKQYQLKHPVAAGYAENVRRADLGGKGIWYRLRIGSFADKDAANTLCDKLKADGGTCLLAK